MLTSLHLHGATFGCVFQHEIDHAGDRVRTVLRRRAVTKDFNALQRDARDHANVDAVRSVTGGRCEELHERGAMTALAVYEDQGLVGCRTAQRRWAHECAAVTRSRSRRVRRYKGAQVVCQVRRIADRVEFIGIENVDGDR